MQDKIAELVRTEAETIGFHNPPSCTRLSLCLYGATCRHYLRPDLWLPAGKKSEDEEVSIIEVNKPARTRDEASVATH